MALGLSLYDGQRSLLHCVLTLQPAAENGQGETNGAENTLWNGRSK